ncbi:MAG: hypothetical protein Q8P50_18480, partial [Bacillota bacterium]|nr:hypothetical protein [Bacillota bacterium]
MAGDVEISGDTVVAVRQSSGATCDLGRATCGLGGATFDLDAAACSSTRVIDCTGLVLTPGFIDIHN